MDLQEDCSSETIGIRERGRYQERCLNLLEEIEEKEKMLNSLDSDEIEVSSFSYAISHNVYRYPNCNIFYSLIGNILTVVVGRVGRS
jgi:hypothetical protein